MNMKMYRQNAAHTQARHNSTMTVLAHLNLMRQSLMPMLFTLCELQCMDELINAFWAGGADQPPRDGWWGGGGGARVKNKLFFKNW